MVGVRDFADLQRRLRLVRRAEILRLGVRELGWGTTEEVARELSAFADVCLDVAVAFCDAALTRELGPARADSGAPTSFVVMAMGKLGGQELNFRPTSTSATSIRPTPGQRARRAS